ncbi:unnamed protein product, partial [Brassica rapa subsp. narinosa]
LISLPLSGENSSLESLHTLRFSISFLFSQLPTFKKKIELGFGIV